VVAPEQPAYPIIEVPDTQEGWGVARRELQRRVAEYVGGPDVPVAVPGRRRDSALPLRLRMTNPLTWGYQLELAGDVALPGGLAYYCRGYHPHDDIARITYAGRFVEPETETARRVRELVRAACEAEGEHTRVLTVYGAYCAVDEQARFGASGDADVLYLAHRGLLRLAVVDHLRGKARDAATALVEDGYMGPVQDLLDAATAVAAQVGG